MGVAATGTGTESKRFPSGTVWSCGGVTSTGAFATSAGLSMSKMSTSSETAGAAVAEGSLTEGAVVFAWLAVTFRGGFFFRSATAEASSRYAPDQFSTTWSVSSLVFGKNWSMQ